MTNETSTVSLFLLIYSAIIAIVAVGALAAFLSQVSAFQRSMREILGDLGDGAQYRSLTAETGAGLQAIFSRIPAMAFCFQSYFQALIPPQDPYDPYYRSGREAAHTFDRDFILKTSLGLRLYAALPSVLVSLGTLGTIIGLAACIYSAQPLLASSDAKTLGEMVSTLFSVGAKAFWPAGLGIIGAVSFHIVERVQTSQSSDMIQAVTLVLDSGLTPHSIEQIAATSLTEMRKTHKTLQDFTNTYFATLHTTVSKIVSRSGSLTVEDLLEQHGERFISPMHRDVTGFRAETKENLLAFRVETKENLQAFRIETSANFETVRSLAVELSERLFLEIESARAVVRDEVSRTRDEVSRTRDEVTRTCDEVSRTREEVTRTCDEVSRTREEVSHTRVDVGERLNMLNGNMLAAVTRVEDGLRQAVRILADGQDQIRTDLAAKLEWLRGELNAVASDIEQGSERVQDRLLAVLGEAARVVQGELEYLRHTVTTEFANIDVPSLHMRTANIAHNLAGIHEVVAGSREETRRLATDFGAYSDRSAGDLRSFSEQTRDTLSLQFGVQAELTQTLLAQLRDSAQIIASDVHQSTKVMEEVVAVDLAKQTHLLQQLTDRVGMQGNRMAEAVLSVGEDIAHRVDLVATVLVGEGIAVGTDLSPFLTDVREKLSKWAPETAYEQMRTKLSDFVVDKRLEEGDSRRAAERADVAGGRRLENRTGLIERVHQLHGERTEQAEQIQTVVRDDMKRASDDLQKQMEDRIHEVARRLESMNGTMSQEMSRMTENMGRVSDDMGRRVDSVSEEVGRRVDSVSEEVGRRVGSVSEEVGRRVDSVSEEVGRRMDVVSDEVGRRVDAVSGQMAHSLDELMERMSMRLDKLGRRMDARIADISTRVQEELSVIGGEVEAIAEHFDMRKIDTMAVDIENISGLLEQMPLSTIKVVNMKAALAPRGRTESRTANREETRDSSYEQSDDYDDESDVDYDRPLDSRRTNLSRPSGARRRGRSAS